MGGGGLVGTGADVGAVVALGTGVVVDTAVAVALGTGVAVAAPGPTTCAVATWTLPANTRRVLP